MKPSVGIAIVNYNGAAFVADAVRSALAQDYTGSFEVIVVDNASTDDSLAQLRLIDGIRVIPSPTNHGFGAGANIARKALDTDYVAYLNPDARAAPAWISSMIPWMEARHIEVASSVVSAGARTWFAGGRFFEILGATLVSHKASETTDWVSGCALVAKRSTLDTVGGFDEHFFLYYEDVDLSLTARAAGRRIGVLNEILVDHPVDGRSAVALGRRKIEIGYHSRGRLIGKHVRGPKRLPALLFAVTVSPVVNRVGYRSFVPAVSSVLAGFRTATRERKRIGRDRRRPLVGVLLNGYERTSGLGAGGNRHFVEVVRRWRELDVVLFGPASAKASCLAELPQARYVTLPSLENERFGKAVDFLYRSVAWVGQIGRLRECDVLLATSHFLPDVVPAILSGKPTVVIIHHLMGGSGSALRSSIVPQLSEEAALVAVRIGARGILVSSELVARELRERSFRTAIDVTTSGVDHIAFNSAFDLESERREGAIFIGRMHPAKGALDAVKAWRRVVNVRPDARLTLIGAREVEAYAKGIEAFIASEGLRENVVIRGKISEAEKLSAMLEAELFLFPSREEGWGIAVAEAMRAGLPCVTYDLPIFSEVFPAGRLESRVGDIDALARHVIEIMENPALKSRLSREASTLAAAFSWERAAAIEAGAVKAFLPR